jgi:hypothetical protein
MTRKTPAERARELVLEIKPEWDRITKGDINLRYELFHVLCVDATLEGGRKLKAGLPTLYVLICAKNGDGVAYDLLTEFGFELDFKRPKRPGRVATNAARDFVVHFLVTVLMLEFPELCPSANDSTPEGTSAADLIRKAIEGAGLGCIDYRGPVENAPVTRSMERAVRRFRDNASYRELFWHEEN